MARKKKEKDIQVKPIANGVIAGAGDVVEQKIAQTIEVNYMPYDHQSTRQGTEKVTGKNYAHHRKCQHKQNGKSFQKLFLLHMKSPFLFLP